ncbi:hypothetical protein [Ferrimonas senticii]|uniref:hypothetical protein n=1 Tax=Ferrimonas senticii TaxID=394566 RepID=UPI00040AA6B3|nr:hypothetical protein [Ferrimonas senticii]
MTVATEQQLSAIDQQLTLLLSQSEQALSTDWSALLAERQRCLTALSATELGQQQQWLQQQIAHTQQLLLLAAEQRQQCKQRLGGYRKGRGQVMRYQQIEAGKG